MVRKVSSTIAITMLAVFASGPFRGITILGRFACPDAAAQSAWNDGSASDAQPNGVSSIPEKTTPSVAGSWAGTVADSQLGAGDIAMNITQVGNKLSGLWDCDFCGGGGPFNFKGTINSKGTLHLNLSDGGKCHLNAVGMLVGPHEITGPYKVLGCGKSTKGDHGTFDITD